MSELKPWKIVPWTDKGVTKYKVEDHQGYNFSFDSMDEAKDFCDACGLYLEEIVKQEKARVARFKEELYS